MLIFISTTFGLTYLAIKLLHFRNRLDQELNAKKKEREFHEQRMPGDFDELFESIEWFISDNNYKKALFLIDSNFDNSTPEQKTILKEIKLKLEDTVKVYGYPLKKSPELRTVNLIGQMLCGDTLYFVVLLIPVFPIARYSVSRENGGRYKFYGQFELHKWQKNWQYIVYFIVVLFLLILILSSI